MERMLQIPRPESTGGNFEAFEPHPLLCNPHLAIHSFLSSRFKTRLLSQTGSLVAPERGGHCAFISRNAGPERFWAESRVVEFCLLHSALTA